MAAVSNDVLNVILGFIFFPSLYVVSHVTVRLLAKNRLNTADIYVICERIVCTLQGVLASVVGCLIVKECHADVLYDRHWITTAYASFGAPYFYYDTVAMFLTFWHITPSVQSEPTVKAIKKFIRSQALMLVHHLVFPVLYLPIIVWWRRDQGDFFVACFFLTELVIPFLSLRAVLLQLKRVDTMLYLVNGVLLIVGWFICRILIFPFMFWAYGQQHNSTWWEVPSKIPIKCNVGCFVIFSFQVYWLYFMVRIAVKTFRKKLFSSSCNGSHAKVPTSQTDFKSL